MEQLDGKSVEWMKKVSMNSSRPDQEQNKKEASLYETIGSSYFCVDI